MVSAGTAQLQFQNLSNESMTMFALYVSKIIGIIFFVIFQHYILCCNYEDRFLYGVLDIS